MTHPLYMKPNPLYEHYLRQTERVAALFGQKLNPRWPHLAAEISGNAGPGRALDQLIAQNSDSVDDSVRRRIKVMEEKPVVCIVTGQQMGLFVSPLYIVYKTISAIKLADELNARQPGYCFVPVFWLEGEDHDYDEVKSVRVLDKSGDLRTFSLNDDQPWQGFPMNRRHFREDIDELLFKLRECLTPTEYSRELFAFLKTLYHPGADWLRAFHGHMAGLFSGKGLLFFNAGDKRVKERSREFFAAIVTQNDEMLQSFALGAERIKNSSCKVQVNVQPGRAYLFLTEGGGRRLALERQNGYFVHREAGLKYSRDELLRLLERQPEWFSSTVLTRPLWQSYLLPTLSYVAGPAEIAYWAQLKPAFELFGLTMPHVQPRHSVTLLEPRVAKLLKRFEINPARIPVDVRAFVLHHLKEKEMPELKAWFEELHRMKDEKERTLLKLVEEIDPTLKGPARKSFYRAMEIMDQMHSRLVRRLREKETLLTDQLTHVHRAIIPAGAQERVLGAIYFQNKYGTRWLEQLFKELPDRFDRHRYVEI